MDGVILIQYVYSLWPKMDLGSILVRRSLPAGGLDIQG